MSLEIERKFLVNKKKWDTVDKSKKHFIRQAYLMNENNKTVRVRVEDDRAFLTLKGPTAGFTGREYEYEIPLTDAIELLNDFAESEISKYRYIIEYKKKKWEVDVFQQDNDGLIIAEIEMETETEKFEIPDWIEKEVTHDERYYNSNLIVQPYKNWKDV